MYRASHSPCVNLSNRSERSSRLTWPPDAGLRNKNTGNKQKIFQARVSVTMSCDRAASCLNEISLADGVDPPASLEIAAGRTRSNQLHPTFPTNDVVRGSPSPPQLFAEHWVWTGSGGKPWLQAWIVICTNVDSNTAHRASLATALFRILSCTRPPKWAPHRGWRNL